MESDAAACATSYVKDFCDFLLSMYDKSPTITAVVVFGAFAYAFYNRWLTHLERKIVPMTTDEFRATIENGKEMRQGRVMNAETTGASDE